MFRSYTINFTYNNHSYMAVVTHAQGAVSVYVPDESLYGIIPGGRFSFNAEQGLNIDTTSLTPLQTLLLTVQAAIEGHAKQSCSDNA